MELNLLLQCIWKICVVVWKGGHVPDNWIKAVLFLQLIIKLIKVCRYIIS